MTLEPVFAAVLAAAVGGEHLSALAIAGGLVVVASMFVADLGPRECCDALSPALSAADAPRLRSLSGRPHGLGHWSAART